MLVQELEPIEREILVKAAILAPSMHNTQPWRFRFRHRTVEVHKDPNRELAAEDPHGRMTLIGVGAAVLNLRVAAASLGLTSTVSAVQDVDRPNVVAEVTVESAASEPVDPAPLFPYLSRRRTNRHPYADRPVPTEARQELGLAAAHEGALLEWIDDAGRARWLLELATDADIAEADDPRRIAERQLWVGGQRTRDGVPSSALGPRPSARPAPVRDLAVDPADQVREPAEFERRPTLAVMWTARDDPPAWLVAGQALQRVMLVATANGLATSFLNQPIEHADLRWLIRDPSSGWVEPQIVLRFGYGPEVPSTPRRPAGEFVLDEPDERAEPATSAHGIVPEQGGGPDQDATPGQ